MFQLGSGLLDGCVLAVLAREDAYGYSLTQDIKQLIPVSESTLYPVLRRLQSEHLLTTYDQSHSGRNRRYYRITDSGHSRLRDTQTAWTSFKTGVDSLLSMDETIEQATDKAEESVQASTSETTGTELATISDTSTTDTASDTQKGGDEQ